MSDGAAGLKKFGDEYDNLHGRFTDQMAKDADETTKSWGRLGTAISGLSDQIGLLGPRLDPAITGMTKFISAHREFVANVATGGLALAGIAAISSGPVLGAIRGLASPFLKFGGAAIKGAGMAIEAVGNFSTALRAGYGVMEAFSLVGLGPIGLVIAGVVALAGAAFLIWKYWGPIKDFFKNLWDGILGIVKAAYDKIKPLLDPLLKWNSTATGANQRTGPRGVWHPNADAQSPVAGVAAAAAGAGDEDVSARSYRQRKNALQASQRPFSPPAAPLPTGVTQKSEAKMIVEWKNVPPDVKIGVSTKGDPNLDMSVGRAMSHELMPAIALKVGGNLGALPSFFGKIAKQVPFAAARALNDTIKAAQRDYRSTLPSVFDRPTPFTLNSAFTRPASKTDLRASLELRHFAAKGTPADRYLGPEILSGDRGMKRFERALSGLSGGAFVVPGRGAQLDAYGNISRGQIVQILSRLNALGDQSAGRKTTGRLRKAKLLVRHGARVAPGDYFVARGRDGRPLGVYRLVSRGHIVPVLIFTRRPPRYRARLPFFQIVERSAAKNFGDFYRKRLAEAVATAR